MGNSTCHFHLKSKSTTSSSMIDPTQWFIIEYLIIKRRYPRSELA